MPHIKKKVPASKKIGIKINLKPSLKLAPITSPGLLKKQSIKAKFITKKQKGSFKSSVGIIKKK